MVACARGHQLTATLAVAVAAAAAPLLTALITRHYRARHSLTHGQTPLLSVQVLLQVLELGKGPLLRLRLSPLCCDSREGSGSHSRQGLPQQRAQAQVQAEVRLQPWMQPVRLWAACWAQMQQWRRLLLLRWRGIKEEGWGWQPLMDTLMCTRMQMGSCRHTLTSSRAVRAITTIIIMQTVPGTTEWCW